VHVFRVNIELKENGQCFTVLHQLFEGGHCLGRKRKRLIDDVADCQPELKKMKTHSDSVVIHVIFYKIIIQ